jgi:hypothetical protein
MAEPNPATWTAATLTATQMNTEVRDSVQWLLGHSSNPKPFVRRRSTAATALTISTWTDVSMNTTVVERGGWSPSGASITVPVAGTYMVGGCAEITAAACNKALRIVKGSTVIVQHDITGVGSSALARINLATMAVLAATDVIKLQAWVDLGSLNAEVGGEFSPVLWAYYVATAN